MKSHSRYQVTVQSMTNNLWMVSFDSLAVNFCDSKFVLVKYRKRLVCVFTSLTPKYSILNKKSLWFKGRWKIMGGLRTVLRRVAQKDKTDWRVYLCVAKSQGQKATLCSAESGEGGCLFPSQWGCAHCESQSCCATNLLGQRGQLAFVLDSEW